MKRKGKRSLVKKSYVWHRRIGVCISIPAFIVAVTGLLLNHPKEFGLDNVFTTNPLVVSWYGMTPSSELLGFEKEGVWIVQLEKNLYLDGKQVADEISELRGATSIGKFLVIASSDSLLLFTRDGKEFVEKINSEVLPSGTIRAVGTEASRLLLDTTNGKYSTSENVAKFKVDSDRSALIPTAVTLIPEHERAAVLNTWRGKGLSLWRVLLDIHSGTFFGVVGTLFADFAAICIVLLVMSGLYNWSKRPTR